MDATEKLEQLMAKIAAWDREDASLLHSYLCEFASVCESIAVTPHFNSGSIPSEPLTQWTDPSGLIAIDKVGNCVYERESRYFLVPGGALGS